MNLRQPPESILFQPFMDQSYTGCSSATVYDVVAFVSVLQHKDNKLILCTKIKQRWQMSSLTKLIDNGEKSCKLFSNARLIILERVRICNSNFIHALIQSCSLSINGIRENDFKTCDTLNDAVKIIETHSRLTNLCSILSSHFTTYHQCPKCQCAPDSLSTIHECISFYVPYSQNLPVCAIPLTRKDITDLYCSACNEKFKDMILHTSVQVHHQYPTILMYQPPRTILQTVVDLRIELTDNNTRCKYVYQPISVLIIDEYNAISVIKLQKLLVIVKRHIKQQLH